MILYVYIWTIYIEYIWSISKEVYHQKHSWYWKRPEHSDWSYIDRKDQADLVYNHGSTQEDLLPVEEEQHQICAWNPSNEHTIHAVESLAPWRDVFSNSSLAYRGLTAKRTARKRTATSCEWICRGLTACDGKHTGSQPLSETRKRCMAKRIYFTKVVPYISFWTDGDLQAG